MLTIHKADGGQIARNDDSGGPDSYISWKVPADGEHHIDKHLYRAPFVCGARNLGEALRRIAEGAALIRTKGEAGTGDVSEAVRHLRLIRRELGALRSAAREEVLAHAKQLNAPYDLVKRVWQEGRLPVPNFAAGGVATPADA